MSWSVTGNVVKADSAAPFQESTNQSGREVVVAGVTPSSRPFEVVLRMQSNADLGDVLGSVGLGDEITVVVTQ